jgi:hypothetical protein
LEERRPEPTAQTQLNEPAGIEIWESFQLNTTTTIDRVVLRDSCHIVKKKKDAEYADEISSRRQ